MKLVQISIPIGIILLILSVYGFNEDKCKDPQHSILFNRMDSVIKYQKTQLDTLVWYNEIGFKIKN